MRRLHACVPPYTASLLRATKSARAATADDFRFRRHLAASLRWYRRRVIVDHRRRPCASLLFRLPLISAGDKITPRRQERFRHLFSAIEPRLFRCTLKRVGAAEPPSRQFMLY